MTINKFRSYLYGSAKFLGNVQAVSRAIETGSLTPILKRIGRVYAGKVTSRGIGILFPPSRRR